VRQSGPFLIESHHPATFRARGVAAPFTTPLLTGTRVRESEKTGIELVVPNPSGGRGVYVLDWAGVRSLGTPTVHDTVLIRRLSGCARLDPAAMRSAALAVAQDGYAGRNAVAAATQAIADSAAQCLQAHFLLIVRLVEQVQPAGLTVPSTAARTSDIDRRSSTILHRLAPMMGHAPAELNDGLRAMGDLFAPVGLADQDGDARIPRLLARMQETQDSLAGWLRADAGNDLGGLGRAIARAMHTATDVGRAVMALTRAALADPVGLLRRWCTEPDSVIAIATRVDWLLDGWDWICLLWLSAASDEARRMALLEMAQLIPVLPIEAGAWTDVAVPAEAMQQPCRVTSREDAWRSGGAAFALIGRNESLRAMCR
jgi:hypothetical protein